MPLIRYRTGDLSRFVPDGCPCGTLLKTMERIRTRLHSIRPIAQGERLSMADLDEAVFPVENLMDFSASLTGRQGIDYLRIEAQAAGDVNAQTVAAIKKALCAVPAIRSALRDGSLSLDVSLLPQGRNPLSGDSKRVLLDLRDEERSPLS
jgi:phenylacetate-coenzyme A ligase PaaK-like adenylate-forming protein